MQIHKICVFLSQLLFVLNEKLKHLFLYCLKDWIISIEMENEKI